jgi:ribonucleoside-diphosphate reductase alpha chain
VDNAVSKTINLPHAAAEDIADIYRRAWEWGLKGITVYRYGRKGQQVLELGDGENAEVIRGVAISDEEHCGAAGWHLSADQIQRRDAAFA